MRSWLFVPGDSERKLAKAFGAGADIVILDLEDSVAPDRKHAARALVREALQDAPGPAAVRINPLSSADLADDMAVVAGAPHSIVLPKSESGADVAALAHRLAVAEAEAGLPVGQTQIMAIATETAAAMFNLGTYAGVSARLCGLAWGMEDLSSALGATRRRTEDGMLTSPFSLARSLCLMGAHAATVLPIDTVHTAVRDHDALTRECAEAAADGFLGKMAIHPAQVPIINDAFTPTPAALAAAQKIVDAFADDPAAGVLSLDGEMVDRPHLALAERLLARAANYRTP